MLDGALPIIHHCPWEVFDLWPIKDCHFHKGIRKHHSQYHARFTWHFKGTLYVVVASMQFFMQTGYFEGER